MLFAAINMFEKDLFNNLIRNIISKNGLCQLVKLLEKTIMMSNTVINILWSLLKLMILIYITNKEIFILMHLVLCDTTIFGSRFPIFLEML